MTTPTMQPGTVEMVSVAWIMRNADSSIDDFNLYGGGVDYWRMMIEKANDHGFPALVNAIVSEGFRIPIVLVKNYNGSSSIMHGNGHHRMCAAILLCLDQIPVYWTDWDEEEDYMCVHTSESGVPPHEEGPFAGFSFGEEYR